MRAQLKLGIARKAGNGASAPDARVGCGFENLFAFYR
jgi:hypothetical protein